MTWRSYDMHTGPKANFKQSIQISAQRKRDCLSNRKNDRDDNILFWSETKGNFYTIRCPTFLYETHGLRCLKKIKLVIKKK